MSPRDQALWLRFHRRASQLSPDLARALLDAFDIIREELTPEEIDRLIQGDDALLDRAFIRARSRLQQAVEKGFDAAVPQLPKAGKVGGNIGVAFDTLNPKVIDAIRALDSRVIRTLKDEVKETVRAYVENGIRDGKSPRTIAKDLRPVIGLSSKQAESAEKFAQKLRDAGKSEVQVEKSLATYQRKAIALNANTNARTATVDAMKLGQKLTWQDAIDRGIVAPGTLYKTWRTVQDDRVRPTHRAMNGETVPFENYYSNGEDVPGEADFNCRCISVMTVRKPTA